jgi:hypothetical protein
MEWNKELEIWCLPEHENQSARPKSKWNTTLTTIRELLLIKPKKKDSYVVLCMLRGTQNQGK